MTTRHLLSLTTGLLLSLAAVPGAIADQADPPCAPMGNYQDLLNLGSAGCTVNIPGDGSLTFSNFQFTPGGLNPPTPSEVGYSVLNGSVTDPDGEPLFGFDFNPAITGPLQDVLLQYKVVPSGTSIISAELLTNGFGGINTVTETLMFCTAADPDPTLGTCHTFSPIVVGNLPGLGMQADVDFGPWTSMTVNKDINCIGCTSISLVRDGFDVTGVPEPTTYGLVSIGLLAVGYFRRRRTAR